MLRTLRIRDIALIDRLTVSLEDGFTVLTGETGAGKSIIIEALNFVLGERASRELIRTGAQKAAVEAAFALEPDVGVAIDVTVAGGTPKADPPMPVYVGKGPAVKIKDSGSISTPVVRDALIAAARRAGVPFQYEVLPYGGTDASAIVTTRGGIPAGTLSIPCLYVHSPVETVSLRDMEQSVALLKAYVEGLE